MAAEAAPARPITAKSVECILIVMMEKACRKLMSFEALEVENECKIC